MIGFAYLHGTYRHMILFWFFQTFCAKFQAFLERERSNFKFGANESIRINAINKDQCSVRGSSDQRVKSRVKSLKSFSVYTISLHKKRSFPLRISS